MSVEAAKSLGVSLRDFWGSIQEESETDQKELEPSTCLQSSVQTVHEFIQKRGGFAYLTGLVLVPSQFRGPTAKVVKQILAKASRSELFSIERFSLDVQGSQAKVEGLIYYPKGWDRSDRSRCVLYHNPNGITLSEYFEEEGLAWTPGEILKIAQCPILLYDYRGTGLSSEGLSFSSLAFKPTYDSVVLDGQMALQEAIRRFETVNVFGSSLGGGVATLSLARHLRKCPADRPRLSLTNHDSFSTTPKIVMPYWPRLADGLGWVLGGLLDAQSSMQELMERRVPITVLCHQKDPVIPEGARMAEWMETRYRLKNVSIIYSPHYGHANLSADMVHELEALFQKIGRV